MQALRSVLFDKWTHLNITDVIAIEAVFQTKYNCYNSSTGSKHHSHILAPSFQVMGWRIIVVSVPVVCISPFVLGWFFGPYACEYVCEKRVWKSVTENNFQWGFLGSHINEDHSKMWHGVANWRTKWVIKLLNTHSTSLVSWPGTFSWGSFGMLFVWNNCCLAVLCFPKMVSFSRSGFELLCSHDNSLMWLGIYIFCIHTSSNFESK